jgi:hypothetical protein
MKWFAWQFYRTLVTGYWIFPVFVFGTIWFASSFRHAMVSTLLFLLGMAAGLLTKRLMNGK